jgi:hypothetical protein
MTNPVSELGYPGAGEEITREVLARLDELSPCSEHSALLPAIGFSRISAIVAGVCLLGLLVTVTLLPEPKGISLEELTETRPGRVNMALVTLSQRATLPRSSAKS